MHGGQYIRRGHKFCQGTSAYRYFKGISRDGDLWDRLFRADPVEKLRRFLSMKERAYIKNHVPFYGIPDVAHRKCFKFGHESAKMKQVKLQGLCIVDAFSQVL